MGDCVGRDGSMFLVGGAAEGADMCGVLTRVVVESPNVDVYKLV